MFLPFCEFLEADFEFPVLVCILVRRNVQKTLSNVEGTLVDGSGYAPLKLHLKKFSVRGTLAEGVLQTFNFVLHS